MTHQQPPQRSEVTRQLADQGVENFNHPFEKLMDALRKKSRQGSRRKRRETPNRNTETSMTIPALNSGKTGTGLFKEPGGEELGFPCG
jgi:hypothetical protein